MGMVTKKKLCGCGHLESVHGKKWVWSISEVGVIFEEFDFILTLRTILLKWVSLLHCDHISHEGAEPLGVDKVKITQEAVIKMEQDT